ncbi:type II and III secretion system protein family protein [Polynucleobacter arcticus]|uniref:Uncharacterized protein n=1 Tax=Polynucleobacter arcticus TaxID=1743165 RepID=A0A6M9PI58_9BURK|nr:pilus assembly protein N-terminal domain-containing protein [Polynucleobacter arcticus]QKM60091.1 hypothetical protein DN92_03020 [Polynucleobacter arcticus]
MKLLNFHHQATSNHFGFIRKAFVVTLIFALNAVNPAFSQERVVGIPTPTSVVAQSKSIEAAQNSIALTVGKTLSYRFKAPVARIAIGNINIADVLSTTAMDVQFLGKKTGSTNVIIWYKDGGSSTLDLIVVGDANYISNLLYKLLPSGNVFQINSAGESIVLAGIAKDADTVQKAVRITEEASGRKVLNMLSTESLPQVLLEVKIAEIDRSVSSALGISFANSNFSYSLIGTGGSTALAAFGAGAGSTQAFLQASEANGLIKILAEPNIMAISGQEGNFLSGGTVYLPISQASGYGNAVVTLTPVEYGIGVRFTPTVLGGNRINLKVAPKVSDVSSNGFSISANGQTQVVPNIKSRSASTTVQLSDGQTFAIGGLINNSVQESIAAFPWLASLPIIGALFRSSAFNSQRSELIILVTPRIVKPLDEKPSIPTDNFVQPSYSEFFLEGKMEGNPNPSKLQNTQEQSNVSK